MAAKNRLATQGRLHGSMTHRPTGVGDCSVESEGDAPADSRLFEVICAQLMDRRGPRSNPGGKIRV
jgi:hypothetical protein